MSTSELKQVYEAYNVVLPGACDISVDVLIDDWEGFRILLRNHITNGVIRIAFDTHLAYQARDESDFIGEAPRSEGFDRGGNGCFYRVRNSEYVARYLRDSLRGYASSELTHFAIVTGDQCIDVIALTEPRIDDLKEALKDMASRSFQRTKS
jgi:hypothetical protein